MKEKEYLGTRGWQEYEANHPWCWVHKKYRGAWFTFQNALDVQRGWDKAPKISKQPRPRRSREVASDDQPSA